MSFGFDQTPHNVQTKNFQTPFHQTSTNMRCTAINLSKRTLKHGGKSGVLPKVRPIFKHNPIIPPSEWELAEEAKIEQGYAEGIPVPKRRGFKITRNPERPAVVPVEERLQKIMEHRAPPENLNELSPEERWEVQKNQIRMEHLKEAYMTEAKRVEKIAALKAEKVEADAKLAAQQVYEESEATKLTLPTIDSYLEGPIMRHRTPEEQAIVEEQRLLNRKTMELQVKEAKANKLLELYHAAENFITTEEELDAAIADAFEHKIGRFESSERLAEDKLFGYSGSSFGPRQSERLVRDEILGEVHGKPGLATIEDTLSGDAVKFTRDAEAKLNNHS